MNPKYIVGGLIIIVFTVWAAVSFNSSLTPYVSISEAKERGDIVQLKGARLDNGAFNIQTNMFTFRLGDEASGEQINVIYDGPKPGNFDQATHVVCVGRFENGAFHATDLLVKCPSKYQEEGTSI